MDSKHLAAIDQQETQINQSIYKINQVILDLQNLLDSNNAILITEYTSRVEEFKNFPPQFHVFTNIYTPRYQKRTNLPTVWNFVETIHYPTRPIVDNEGRLQWSCRNPRGGVNTICL